MDRHLTFKVKGNNYNISFPTVAQFIDIETMKARLANDSYGSMVKTGTVLSIKALDYIDMICNITIMIPELLKDLKTNNLLNLDIFDAKELLAEYQTQYMPWMVQWQKILAELPTVQEEEVEEDEITDQDISDAEAIASQNV